MPFIPHTQQDIRQMLESIGVDDVETLFCEIPQSLRLDRPLELGEPRSETEVLKELQDLAQANATSVSHASFLGGGAYNHFIPAAVDHLISRSEFYTAYTPYQPEISQGTLQAIFEFQSMICQLTGMDVANASLYDGASGTAEAVLMAMRATRRNKVVISSALHPDYRQTIATYCRFLEVELVEIPFGEDGRTDPGALRAILDRQTAAVVAGYPNYFGIIEDLSGLAETAHECGAKMIATIQEPVSLGLLKSPGELGVDIVAGEGQSFGMPVSFGGPFLGFFAARKKDLRALPGRLVGQATDIDGRRGFVLTLATREQHIRREKATSNICSNQGLCALMATIYLALLGKQGIREVAEQNLAKAEYAKKQIGALDGFRLPFSPPTFNEFVVEGPEPAKTLLKRLADQNILGGIALGKAWSDMDNRFLVCVTEQNSREEIDRLVQALSGGGQ